MGSDPDQPVTVATAENEIAAGVIVSALEAAGIEARMVGEYTSGFRAEAPGQVAVIVRQADAEKAHAVLDDLRTDEA